VRQAGVRDERERGISTGLTTPVAALCIMTHHDEALVDAFQSR
jgi:hypothetical protein